jgi:hypothetical protein
MNGCNTVPDPYVTPNIVQEITKHSGHIQIMIDGLFNPSALRFLCMRVVQMKPGRGRKCMTIRSSCLIDFAAGTLAFNRVKGPRFPHPNRSGVQLMVDRQWVFASKPAKGFHLNNTHIYGEH